jgi:hypothetical protein
MPDPGEPDVPTKVKFNPEYFDIVEDIQLRLQPQTGESESIFPASVETLNGDLEENGRRSGEVILYVFNENEILRTRVNLNAEQYAIADTAHMNAGFVVFKGLLQRGRRVHRVTNIEDFRLLAPPTQHGSINSPTG